MRANYLVRHVPKAEYSNTCVKMATLKETRKLGFKTDYRLMKVKSIAEC